MTRAVLTAHSLAALVSAVAILASAAAALGQEARTRIDVNPYVGAFVFDDSELGDVGLEANVGPIVGARVIVPFAPPWWVEGAYGYAPLTVEPSEFGDEEEELEQDLNIHLLYGGIGYLISSRDLPTRLLLSAGLGGMMLQPENEDSTTDFIATVGVGFTHPVNDWITFRGDVRDHVLFCRTDDEDDDFEACLDDEGLNNIEISGGLMFRLRGR